MNQVNITNNQNKIVIENEILKIMKITGGNKVTIKTSRGDTGPQGPQGIQGDKGDRGSVWRTGTGAPSNSLGVDGDFYLEDVTGDYYERVSGSYVLQGNLKGPQGDNTDHDVILNNGGVGSHAIIQDHMDDGTIHYLQTDIDHTVIQNKGQNTHAQIDSHISNGDIHFTMLDEDDMASDSDTQTATQQSIKAFVGNELAKQDEVSELKDVELNDLKEDDILRYRVGNQKWVNEAQMESYIPVAKYLANPEKGEKGTWTFIDGLYYFFIGTDTVISFYSKDNLDLLLTNYVLADSFIEGFVPITQISDQDSEGEKGQWSFSNDYFYRAVGKNTWVRHAVERVFIV